MKVGDLVKLDDAASQDHDRNIGTILHFSLYKGETIVNVMWNTGEKTWVLKRRLAIMQSRAN